MWVHLLILFVRDLHHALLASHTGCHAAAPPVLRALLGSRMLSSGLAGCDGSLPLLSKFPLKGGFVNDEPVGAAAHAAGEALASMRGGARVAVSEFAAESETALHQRFAE